MTDEEFGQRLDRIAKLAKDPTASGATLALELVETLALVIGEFRDAVCGGLEGEKDEVRR